MKIFLGFMSLSFAFTVAACPDLSGLYGNCKVEGYYPGFQAVRIGITQSQMSEYSVGLEDREGRVEIFTLLADGIARTQWQTEEGASYKITTTTSCNGESLQVKELVEVEDMDFSMKSMEAWTREENKLRIDVSVEDTHVATVTCEKILK